MTDNGFTPLVPRRLVGGQATLAPPDGEGQATLAPPDGGGQASLSPPDVGGQTSLAPPDAVGQTSLAPPDVRGQASLAPFESSADRRRAPVLTRVSAESEETRIRAAAVDLAAAACARALRYAVDRNPRLLARFVDDALRAAGSPKSAIVRLAPPTAIAAAATLEHDVVADSTLSPGDVFVDCDAGELGATIEERAARLVRAAAS
jgi:Flagellar assembly protein FliH